MIVIMNSYTHFYNERRYSQITDEFPDQTNFPLYYKANKQEFILNPGEYLVIPAKWPHLTVTESADITITSTFFYSPSEDSNLYLSKYTNNIDLDKLLPDNNKIEVKRTSTNCFISNLAEHRFEGVMSTLYMTFKDYLDTENKKLAIIIQNHETNIPVHAKEANESYIRINNGKNMYTQLHFESDDSIMCQIKGIKRILVFPPEDIYKLYFFNTYDLDLIERIHKTFFLDKYVYIKSDGLTTRLCDELRDGLKEHRTRKIEGSDILNSLFRQHKQDYVELMSNERAWFDFSNDMPKSFTIKDTREEGEIVIDSMDSCVTVIFIINNGTVRIGKYVYNVKAGDVITFPSSITHPWTSYINTIVMYPNFS